MTAVTEVEGLSPRTRYSNVLGRTSSTMEEPCPATPRYDRAPPRRPDPNRICGLSEETLPHDLLEAHDPAGLHTAAAGRYAPGGLASLDDRPPFNALERVPFFCAINHLLMLGGPNPRTRHPRFIPHSPGSKPPPALHSPSWLLAPVSPSSMADASTSTTRWEQDRIGGRGQGAAEVGPWTGNVINLSTCALCRSHRP